MISDVITAQATAGSVQGMTAPRSVLLIGTLALAIVSAVLLIYVSMPMPASIAADFKVFWTAGQLEQPLVYDFAAVTAAIPGETGLRPYLSPPTLLLAMAPLAEMPLWPAFLLWSVGGLAFFCAASSRVAGKASILILLAAPAFHWTLVAGQVTLLVGGLIYFGLASLSRRPIAAGLIFACAALLKPQAALLIPVALIAGGHYRALGAASAAGMVGGLVSVALQGPGLWLGWLGAIRAFSELIQSSGFIGKSITPAGFAYWSGVGGSAETAIIAAGALLGLICCWLVFRKTDDAALRGGAVICGALLCTPYAMGYEAMPLLPAAAALLTRRSTGAATLLTASLIVFFPFASLSIAFFALGLIARLEPRGKSEAAAGLSPAAA
jgi:hypothetical protein